MRCLSRPTGYAVEGSVPSAVNTMLGMWMPVTAVRSSKDRPAASIVARWSAITPNAGTATEATPYVEAAISAP